MINTSKKITTLILVLIFAQACNNIVEPKKEEIVYDLLSSSKEKFPYKKTGRVIFTDSLNNQCIFEVSNPKSMYLSIVEPVIFEDHKTGEVTNFTITTERYGCYLKCDSLNLEFHILLQTVADKNSIQNRIVKDQLSIFEITRDLDSTSSNRTETQISYFTLDQRNYPGKEDYNLFDQMTLQDIQYFDVIEPENSTPNKMKIFYSHEFGILTFTDEQDNYWCYKDYIVENGL